MGQQYVLIVDFSHLWHMAHYAALNAGPQYDLAKTIIHNAEGKLRTIRKVLEKHKIIEYDVIFAEDRPATRKVALYPNYRAGRVNHADAKNQLKQHFLANGYKQRFCWSDGNEADDVIATLVKLTEGKGIFTVVVTGDRDIWQLIGPTTAVLNPLKKEIVTLEDVHKAFAVGPPHVALVKTLWGDASDCIPNAVPRAQKLLLPIVRQSDGSYSHFSLLVEEQWDNLSATCREKLKSGHTQCELNWELVKLDNECFLKWD